MATHAFDPATVRRPGGSASQVTAPCQPDGLAVLKPVTILCVGARQDNPRSECVHRYASGPDQRVTGRRNPHLDALARCQAQGRRHASGAALIDRALNDDRIRRRRG